MDAYERAMVRAIDRQRSRRGLARIRGDAALARAANFPTREMLRGNSFSPSSHSSGAFHVRVRRFAHRRAVGETLALVGGSCAGTVDRVIRMWMNSPGHRAILLSSSFRRIGLGKRIGDLHGSRACLVTADFGSRK